MIPYAAQVIPTYLPRLVSTEMRARTVAYVCRELSCSLPVDSPEALQAAL